MKTFDGEERRTLMEVQGKLFDGGVEKIIENLDMDLENHPALLLIVKSFFKDEEWINYLVRMFDKREMMENFEKRLKEHFEPIFVTSTDQLDLIAVVNFSNEMLPSEGELLRRIERLEEDLIVFFMSEKFLGKIKKQVDIFQNPFKNFFDFSVGYAFIRSHRPDDIMSATSIAMKMAEVRKSSKFDDLTKELLRIIDRKRIESHFQPIIDIKNRRVFAYEALARGPKGSPLRRPDLLFKVAAYNGLELELDRLARRTHIERFAEIHKKNKDVKLTVNLGPFTPLFVDEVDRDLKRFDLPSDSIIWEVSERTYIDDFVAFSRVIEYLRTNGYRIAVDDFGAGAATFKLIFSIYTNMIKIDKGLVENVESDTAKLKFLEKMISCFYKPDGLVVIEGVETESEFKTLMRIGYRYFQGFHFFRPSPVPVDDETVKEKLKGIEPDPDHMYFPSYFEE